MLNQQDMTETAKAVFDELSDKPATAGEIAQNTHLSRERCQLILTQLVMAGLPSLALSAWVTFAGPARRKPKPSSSEPKRTPPPASPRQNVRQKSRKRPAMYSKLLAICLMTMLIGSCAKTLPAPVVVDTACNWVRIIYLTDHDIDVLDKQTKRDILAHNKSVQANCPQPTGRVTR